jgi:hypothetical protein
MKRLGEDKGLIHQCSQPHPHSIANVHLRSCKQQHHYNIAGSGRAGRRRSRHCGTTENRTHILSRVALHFLIYALCFLRLSLRGEAAALETPPEVHKTRTQPLTDRQHTRRPQNRKPTRHHTRHDLRSLNLQRKDAENTCTSLIEKPARRKRK